MRRYPTNREFIKNLRHNGHTYTLRSVFDKNNYFSFDNAIKRCINLNNIYNFDKSIEDIFDSYYFN